MLNPGDQIGDWIIERILGEGAMGAVFRCRNALTERISAAVKVMKPERVEDVRDRFLREVESLDGLNHPAIVRVKGWGEDTERGLLWLAMDLVEGEDMSDRLRKGAMTVDEAVAVFTPLAEGLAHAHGQGICHRDIKPANILVSKGSGRLVDFGIAMDSGRTRMTAMGQVPGTPAYLAPEVFGGTPAPAALDIYALGQVLCEALTGREAFPEQPNLGTTQRLANLMGQKIQSGPLDPGEGCPEYLRALVRRATHPQPNGRLATMDEFVRGINGEPLAASDFGAAATMDLNLADLPEPVAEPAPPPIENQKVPAPSEAPAVKVEAPVPSRMEQISDNFYILLSMVVAAGVTASWLLPLVFSGLGPRTVHSRDVEVVITGLAAGSPIHGTLDGIPADRVDGFKLHFSGVSADGSHQMRAMGGSHCEASTWSSGECPKCCACIQHELRADGDTEVLMLEDAITEATVTVIAPEVAEPWTLQVNLDGGSGRAIERNIWQFFGISPGTKTLRIDAGTCPEEAAGCWPDNCPDGCTSWRGEIAVPCGEDEVSLAVPLGNPKEVAQKRPFRPVQNLKGLKIRLPAETGRAHFAQKARKLLERHGASVETPVLKVDFWTPDVVGKTMMFSDGIEKQAKSIVDLLQPLGYLAPPSQEKPDSNIDIVVWLQEPK
jgi:serine/threonine protein kinase